MDIYQQLKTMDKATTPGPWVIGTILANNAEITEDALAIWPASVTESAKEFEQPVCLISPISTINDTDLGNAQLIAAAPDLLEALRELAENYDDFVHEAHEDESYQKALAAIRKATQTPSFTSLSA